MTNRAKAGMATRVLILIVSAITYFIVLAVISNTKYCGEGQHSITRPITNGPVVQGDSVSATVCAQLICHGESCKYVIAGQPTEIPNIQWLYLPGLIVAVLLAVSAMAIHARLIVQDAIDNNRDPADETFSSRAVKTIGGILAALNSGTASTCKECRDVQVIASKMLRNMSGKRFNDCSRQLATAVKETTDQCEHLDRARAILAAELLLND